MNTVTIKSYNTNIDCYTLEFGDIQIILKKNSSINEIYEALETMVPTLVRAYFNHLIEEFDDETKNDFIDHWSTSSDNEKIKDIMMFILTDTLKVYKFKTNSIKCEIVFNSFCNEAFGYLKKNFETYSNMIEFTIAA